MGGDRGARQARSREEAGRGQPDAGRAPQKKRLLGCGREPQRKGGIGESRGPGLDSGEEERRDSGEKRAKLGRAGRAAPWLWP